MAAVCEGAKRRAVRAAPRRSDSRTRARAGANWRHALRRSEVSEANSIVVSRFVVLEGESANTASPDKRRRSGGQAALRAWLPDSTVTALRRDRGKTPRLLLGGDRFVSIVGFRQAAQSGHRGKVTPLRRHSL